MKWNSFKTLTKIGLGIGCGFLPILMKWWLHLQIRTRLVQNINFLAIANIIFATSIGNWIFDEILIFLRKVHIRISKYILKSILPKLWLHSLIYYMDILHVYIETSLFSHKITFLRTRKKLLVFHHSVPKWIIIIPQHFSLSC